MFEDWASYTLSDFILFSPEAYLALFDGQYNFRRRFVLITLDIASILVLIPLIGIRPKVFWSRLGSLCLAATLIFVAYDFLWLRFLPINYMARYYAIGFVVQALLIFYVGVVRGQLFVVAPRGYSRTVGLGLVGYGFIFKLIVDSLISNNWIRSDFFGEAPDPTVIVLIGILILSKEALGQRWNMILLALPILWCVISGLTLMGLDLPGYLPLFIIAVGTVAYSLVGLVRRA